MTDFESLLMSQRIRLTRSVVFALSALAISCGGEAEDKHPVLILTDGGPPRPDSGHVVQADDADSPRSDASETRRDAGTTTHPDSGVTTPIDTGIPDTGGAPVDAGQPMDDAGRPPGDAGRPPADMSSTADQGSMSDATNPDPPDMAPPTVHQIYMAKTGSDSNPGTQSLPIRSLNRANALLMARRPGIDVEVHIAPDVYANQYVNWTYFDPAHTTKFIPWGWDGTGTPQRPVFDGDGSNGTRRNYLFKLSRLSATSGVNTNIEFHWIHVRDYVSAGIGFIGNPDNTAGWLGQNHIENCVFQRIGNKGGYSNTGYGAVELTNARNTRILYNEFKDIENDPQDDGLVHGVYLKHNANDNQVNFNRFDTVSGDPLRVRNASNDNTFHSNTIINSGKHGYFGDWWCNPAIASCSGLECPSFGNSLKYNDFSCTGYNGVVIPPFYFHHGRECVPAGCTDSGARLITAGNKLPDQNADGLPDCSLGATQPVGSGACP